MKLVSILFFTLILSLTGSAQTSGCADTTYLPVITYSGPHTICAGDTIILSAESGYDQYLWSTGETTQHIEVSDSGDYFVSALVDTCWFNSDTLEIFVSDPSPVVVVMVNEFTASPGFESYQWYYNSEPIPGATNQVYCAEMDGTYYVIVIDEFGCEGQSILIEHTAFGGPCDSGLNDGEKSSFEVFPNPALNYVTVEFPVETNLKNAELSILNITGQVLLHSSITTQKSTLDVSGFSKGIYFFRVRTDGNISIRKVSVE